MATRRPLKNSRRLIPDNCYHGHGLCGARLQITATSCLHPYTTIAALLYVRYFLKGFPRAVRTHGDASLSVFKISIVYINFSEFVSRYWLTKKKDKRFAMSSENGTESDRVYRRFAPARTPIAGETLKGTRGIRLAAYVLGGKQVETGAPVDGGNKCNQLIRGRRQDQKWYFYLPPETILDANLVVKERKGESDDVKRRYFDKGQTTVAGRSVLRIPTRRETAGKNVKDNGMCRVAHA
ncbi:hypothetical protein ALC53_09507 [Atta colombica]|uniref:Uncharacterized protein n=1 Tax=Atta colombica TaxID=520822 RepID=A0A195B647_9HYME|nr:hypothetical protein ALC53_09507 [Atta colombica]